MSACYLHHKIPPRCPNSQPICTTPPHNSPIAYRPLCIQSVEVSKQNRTTCQFIYSLLSTPYSVSKNKSNYKQPLYVLLNCAVRSCEHCYCGNVVIICVALFIHRSMRMRYVAICGLPRSTVCFHIIS